MWTRLKVRYVGHLPCKLRLSEFCQIGSSWFLAKRLPSVYPTSCLQRIWASSNIRVLLCGFCPKLWTYPIFSAFFATARRSSTVLLTQFGGQASPVYHIQRHTPFYLGHDGVTLHGMRVCRDAARRAGLSAIAELLVFFFCINIYIFIHQTCGRQKNMRKKQAYIYIQQERKNEEKNSEQMFSY